MAFLSTLIGKPVADVNGDPVGHLDDLIASVRSDMPHPIVTALVIRRPGQRWIVPMSAVAVLIAPAVPLTRTVADMPRYDPASTISTWRATSSTSRSSTRTASGSSGSTTWNWRASTATTTSPTSMSAAWGCFAGWAWPAQSRSSIAAWATTSPRG